MQYWLENLSDTIDRFEPLKIEINFFIRKEKIYLKRGIFLKNIAKLKNEKLNHKDIVCFSKSKEPIKSK